VQGNETGSDEGDPEVEQGLVSEWKVEHWEPWLLLPAALAAAHHGGVLSAWAKMLLIIVPKLNKTELKVKIGTSLRRSQDKLALDMQGG